MKNTVTLSKKEIEEIKTKMFNAGYAAGVIYITENFGEEE